MNSKYSTALHWFIILTFIGLYSIVSIISTIHVIDFFKLSNPDWLAISLAVAFEIGAAASLASIIILDKMNKPLIWGLFISLTLMQMMGNMYFAFTHLQEFSSWVDLFGLADEELVYQKRILSVISGGVLPLIALGFIKSLVDYVKPAETRITEMKVIEEEINEPEIKEPVEQMPDIQSSLPAEPQTPIKNVIPIEDALGITEPEINDKENLYFTQSQAVAYAKDKNAKDEKNKDSLEINKKVSKAKKSARPRYPPAKK